MSTTNVEPRCADCGQECQSYWTWNDGRYFCDLCWEKRHPPMRVRQAARIAELEAERDALRAEVERLRRALEPIVRKMTDPEHYWCDGTLDELTEMEPDIEKAKAALRGEEE